MSGSGTRRLGAGEVTYMYTVQADGYGTPRTVCVVTQVVQMFVGDGLITMHLHNGGHITIPVTNLVAHVVRPVAADGEVAK